MRWLLFSLSCALAAPAHAAIFGLFKDDHEILQEVPDSERELREASEDARTRAQAALTVLRQQVAAGCLVSVLHDPYTSLVPLTDSCAPGSGMPAYYEEHLPKVRIESKWRLRSYWPRNNALLMDAFAAEVMPLARRHFDRNYNVGIGARAISGSIEGVVASTGVTVQGSEFLLRDGRTVLVVRTVYKRDREIKLDGERTGGGYYAFSLQVGLLDVRNLPSRWGLMVEDERTERVLARKAVGDAPLDMEVRDMAKHFWRRLDPVWLSPDGGPALDEPRRAYALALAQKRWDGIARQIEESAADFAAVERVMNQDALSQRSAINRSAAAAAARGRSAIFAGVMQGIQSSAIDLQRREAQFARTRRDAQRFYGTGGRSAWRTQAAASKAATEGEQSDEAASVDEPSGGAAPDASSSASAGGAGGGGASGGGSAPALTATPVPGAASAATPDACRYDAQEQAAADRLGERCHERPFRQGAFCTAQSLPFTSGGRCRSESETRAAAEQQFRALESRSLGNRQTGAEGTSNRRGQELCPNAGSAATARADFSGMRCAAGKVSAGGGWARGLYCIGEFTYRCEAPGAAGGAAGR